jgi:hypothetical protein
MTRKDWPVYYILVGRIPIAVDSLTWARAFEDRYKTFSQGTFVDPWRIGDTTIDERCHVSTVFLGLDHNFFGRSDPVLFETMIFGGPLDGDQWRYCSYDEAERGHAEAVAQARIAAAQVKAIADAAGASAPKPKKES